VSPEENKHRPEGRQLFTAVLSWLTQHEPWFLLVALPPLWLPGAVPALVPLSFALLAALVLCRWAVTGRPVPSTPMNWPILVILLMLPVGLWASPLPETSWVVFCRILLGFVVSSAERPSPSSTAWWATSAVSARSRR